MTDAPGERRRRRFRRLARSGFAVNGVIHMLIGGIAITVAFGDTESRDVDQTGALGSLADHPVGRLLLWGALAGLFALAVWQFAQAVLVTEPSFMKRWGRRFSEAGKSAVYLVLGFTTLVFALGGKVSSADAVREVTGRLLDSQAGTFVVLALGLILIGTGTGFTVIGVRRRFLAFVRLPSGVAGRVVRAVGVAGYISKGIALGMIGVLFVVAVATGDARQATGLDGALRALAALPAGPVVLVLIAVGLIEYGIFLAARARFARFQAPVR